MQKDLVDVEIEVEAKGPSLKSWKRFEGIDRYSNMLISECLSFIGGALIRNELDLELYKIGDALLKDLSELTDINWNRFIVPDTEESLSGISDVIRMRFPEISIWNLPILGHEFGHIAAEKLIPPDFLHSIIRDKNCKVPYSGEPKTPMLGSVYECFSDLFALYSLGPSYACASILLRLDPTSTRSGDGIHPGDAERAYFLLNAMEKLDYADDAENIKGKLSKAWKESLISAGQPETPESAENLDCWLKFLWPQIDRNLNTVRYESWPRAMILSFSMMEEAGNKALKDDYTLADILNAAWICRIGSWKKKSSKEDVLAYEKSIGSVALDLCRQLYLKY